MKAYIMAGGYGTRLNDITKGLVPKPMAVINGKPILEWVVSALKENGVSEIFMSVAHLKEQIIDYFNNGEKFGVKINYILEETPMGSGGALYYLKGKVKGNFIVCSADTIFDINISKMLSYHRAKKAIATLFTHPNLHPYDSDLVITKKCGKVTKLDFKGSVRNYYYKNNVNAGFIILNAKALGYLTEPKKINLEHDFINGLILNGERVYAYKSPEFIKDVGTPERFYRVEKELKIGLTKARNFSNKQKAIFLDRDGTLNVYKGFINGHSQIELADGVIEGIKLINNSGYLAIIVSNQPVIARGEASFNDIDACFDKIETLLGENGGYIDGVYYCPHHPKSGFKGEVKKLKIECDCRKPKIGMLVKAQKDFNLELSSCYIIGDSEQDVKTGINAGIPQIKVKSALTEKESVEPTYRAQNFLDAVKYILKKD